MRTEIDIGNLRNLDLLPEEAREAIQFVFAPVAITRHARARMSQRGLRREDLGVLLAHATDIGDDRYMLRDRDAAQVIESCRRAIRIVKRQERMHDTGAAMVKACRRVIDTFERLRGKVLVICEGSLVTAYHQSRPIHPRFRKARSPQRRHDRQRKWIGDYAGCSHSWPIAVPAFAAHLCFACVTLLPRLLRGEWPWEAECSETGQASRLSHASGTYEDGGGRRLRASAAAGALIVGPATALPFGVIGLLAPQFSIAVSIPVPPVAAGVGVVIGVGVLIYRLRKRSK